MIKRTIDVLVTAEELGTEWANATSDRQVDMLVQAAKVMRSWDSYHRDNQLLHMAEQLREAPIALTLLRDLMDFVDSAADSVGDPGGKR